MVKSLILMRHAQASDERSLSDFERPLTAIGVRDARHMGRWLKSESYMPDMIITSDALRAATTAEIISEELNLSGTLHSEHELYEASVRTALQVITQTEENHQTLLVVGHNPTLSYLSDYLSDRSFPGLQPASLVIIQFEGLSWIEIGEHSGKFISYCSPADLE